MMSQDVFLYSDGRFFRMILRPVFTGIRSGDFSRRFQRGESKVSIRQGYGIFRFRCRKSLDYFKGDCIVRKGCGIYPARGNLPEKACIPVLEGPEENRRAAGKEQRMQMCTERQNVNLLEVNHLTIEFLSDGCWYPTVTDISFHLKEGELLALVGESGCGKSVSCMALCRLLPEPPARISEGEILLRKREGGICDILKLSPGELRKIRGGEIAYVFQEPSMSLNPVFRVGSQIAEAVELHCPDVEDPRREAVELLRQVGIPDPESRAKQYPHELSGGMQQRVMIAMALASRPSILVADEPTTALDVTIQAQILDLLDNLRRTRKMSVILVTHNLGIVSELADRVAVMYAGRMMETAPVRELLDHPCHPYTKALIAAVPVLGGEHRRLSTIPGAVPPPSEFTEGCRFADRCALLKNLDREKQRLCREKKPEMTEMVPGHYCACPYGRRGDVRP